jgi:nucleotide-binding universal stress UspA family protein
MIRRLLVAYDGSDTARAAFDFGAEMATKYGAELHILAVARPPDFGTEEETEAVIEQSRGHCEAILEDLKARLGPRTAVFAVTVGHPADQIVRYTEGHAIDHIVVGHRGRTLFDRLLVGSVARQVVAHARCGVSVIR